MIFNMTGGGSGSGATLVVSCPANVTATVSKDDKSYTKNSGNLGSATFKGLATGEWTVTIEGNEQTATKNITITADYAITIAFFAAYINITYPANSTCTVKTSGGITVASNSNTGTSTKTWRATVGATGTYTITATSTSDSSKTKSTTVDITAEGQVESVTLEYELVLYDSGTDNTAVTGGWGSAHSAQDSVASGGGVTFNADSMIFSSGYHKYGCLSTAKTINTSGYSTINFNITSYTASGHGDYLGLTSNRNAQPSYVAATSISTGTCSVSIASAQGNYYVSIWADRSCTVVVSKIWLA